jgi:hypothetical protein
VNANFNAEQLAGRDGQLRIVVPMSILST